MHLQELKGKFKVPEEQQLARMRRGSLLRGVLSLVWYIFFKGDNESLLVALSGRCIL